MECMVISRLFANVLTDDVPGTRDFYVDLLSMRVTFDSDWFVDLAAEGSAPLELGIWRRDHELIPADHRQPPSGAGTTILTFVVDDVDAVHDDAQRRGLTIVAPPRDLFYGQRQMLLTDPNGVLIDISAPASMSDDFLASLEQDGDTVRQRRS